MKPTVFHYQRLVKSEDLNHHRTLFAGRCAEWFVEAGFVAVASILPANSIVCVKIHGLSFTSPMRSGDIAHFESKIVDTGRTSLKVYVALKKSFDQDPIMTGFITFVHMDQDGHPLPHNIVLKLIDQVDFDLNEQARKLSKDQ